MRKTTLVMVVFCIMFIQLPSNSQSRNQQKDTKKLIKEMRELKEKRKQEREAEIKKFRAKLEPIMKYSIFELQCALTIKVTETYSGAKLFADNEERTYIGTIEDEFTENSIFNEFGTYGSEFSSTSIWNEFGMYGGEFSTHSPFNSFTSTPPFIVKGKKVIGRLTVNKYITGAIDPNWLKSYFKY